MENKNILLISENIEASKLLAQKLVLLRNPDEIFNSSFDEIDEVLSSSQPEVIFLEQISDEELFIEKLDYIKQNKPECVLILLAKAENPDKILQMYDAGVDDYILQSAHPYEVLIKTVNALKQALAKRINQRNFDLLVNSSAVLPQNGFYTELFADEIMTKQLQRVQKRNAAFLIVTYDELDRAKFDVEKLADAVKISIRMSDLVIALKSGKFYILLENSMLEGAVAVFEKIKKALNNDFRIKAGICDVLNKTFQELEQKTSAALTDAMLSANDYVIYKEKALASPDEWTFEPEQNSKKDFKIFKQLYLKKLAHFITPVFFRMQNAYEPILPDTKIDQYTDENQCIFHLKSPKQTSRLTLVYTGLAKVVIYITHSGLDSPENQEFLLALKDLTEPVLVEILENFIIDYKNCIE